MQLVYVGAEGDLYGWRSDDGGARRITWSWDEVDQHGVRSRLRYGWPTCSPDGNRILTLVRRGEQRHFVYVVEAGGVSSQELVSLGTAVPIYANWAPDGARAAVLVQRRQTLALEIHAVTVADPVRLVVRGAPLFWSWAPDGRTLAIHAGNSTDDLSAGGTFLVDVATGETRDVLSAVPAMFRTPSWSADGRMLAFARLAETGTRLILVEPETGGRRSRELPRGPVAFVWHPRLPVLAYATGSDEAPHIYDRVVVLDLREERELAIVGTALAFFWHPERLRLFRLCIDQKRQEATWEATDVGGDSKRLARFLPTRELVFAASFFDQYAVSHTPVAPDGSVLAVVGRLSEDTSASGPSVYVVPTEGSGPSTLVGHGVYAVWST
jgi:WD40-like Beta Propeller Repeat